jgi:F-type H+-transporting ATPase subunit b
VTFEWGTIVKTINWTLVFNLINFAILLYVLNRLLFKPATEYLEKRREMIAGRIEAAKADEQRAAALVEERAGELQRAREQSARILDDARRHAEEVIEQAKRDAKQAAGRIAAEARREMEQERDRMVEELKAAYADIAVMGASRVLDREIRPEDHRRLLDQLLEEIDESELKVRL